MTLKEKFEVEIMDLPITIEVVDDIAKNIEYIAEDFAIEFSTWISVNYYSIGEERWVSWKKNIDILSSKELLEIYKSEQKL